MITIEMLSKTCFLRVATGNDIKGKGNEPFVLALVNGILGEVVTIAVGASMEDEIVILEGDSDNDEADNLSSGEFNKKIVSEWNGRKEQIEAKDDLVMRNESLKVLSDLDRSEAKDLAQKAKVKWAVEGDENTKFLHGILKKKRRNMAIKGASAWLGVDLLKRLSSLHFENMEVPFSSEEIK
ncbi:putative RNA-directed DNA polymerase, eukaryota, reverse transcriptase zinc-binding domain protein [Tanacetum coccineum]